MKITSIVGPMFSGKTTLLTKKIREAKRVPSFHVMVFKPIIDDRYSTEQIVTHDKETEDCIPVYFAKDILGEFYCAYMYHKGKKIIVFIDEAQFFDDEIVDVVQEIVELGAEVICAGLNMDRFGQPFGYMPHLMAISDEIILLKGKCKCGNDSYISYSSGGGARQVMVGAEQYEPLCKKCWMRKMI